MLQAAIQNSPSYVDTDNQVMDCSLGIPYQAAVQPEDGGAVSASLWDIFDPANESHDALSNGLYR